MLQLLALLTPLLQDAEGGERAPGGSAFSWMPLILIFAIFWFVLIVPERKQRRRRQEMIAALKKGDRVLTTGGIYGTVVQTQEEVVTVQVADNVRLRMARGAVQAVLEEEAGEKEQK